MCFRIRTICLGTERGTAFVATLSPGKGERGDTSSLQVILVETLQTLDIFGTIESSDEKPSLEIKLLGIESDM